VATVWTPQRPFPYDIWQRKVIDIAINEVSGALSMHAVPLAIQIVCGTCSSDSPSLPGFTISPCVDSLLCYRSIRWPKSILQDSPEV
jgi:hypothetical protein